MPDECEPSRESGRPTAGQDDDGIGAIRHVPRRPDEQRRGTDRPGQDETDQDEQRPPTHGVRRYFRLSVPSAVRHPASRSIRFAAVDWQLIRYSVA